MPVTTPPTLAVKEAAFLTSMIGKIDKITHNSVIKKPGSGRNSDVPWRTLLASP